MTRGILGKKIGMTQVYDDQGRLHPVTVVQAGPCAVLQVKTAQRDGYDAVQLGFGAVKAHRAHKPQIGHAARAGIAPQQFVREVRLAAPAADVEPGATITVEAFADLPYVDIVGTSKGKGFAGVMKRHNFRGQSASHGTERVHRAPGSISGHATNLGTGPKIRKGKRMPGHMGHERCTARNRRVVAVDPENHLLLIRGPVPGPSGGYVTVRRSKTRTAAES